MDRIGQEHFTALVSDNTNACVCGRDLTVEEVLTLLGLPDCVHHISSFIKDIVKLPYFKEVGKSLSLGGFTCKQISIML